MKSGKYLAALAGAVVAGMVIAPVAAQADSNVAFVARASTQGLGGELVLPLVEDVNIRAGLYGFSLSDSDTASGIDYDLTAKLFSGGAYLDWHTFGGSFRLSAGALYNDNKVTGVNEPSQTLDIGANTYTAADVGELNGRIAVNKFTPYAGIGWGNALTGDGRVKLLFDLGVMFHGTPEATLTADIPADSPLRADPDLMAQFESDLEAERQDFQDDIADYKVYPVVSIGLAVKF